MRIDKEWQVATPPPEFRKPVLHHFQHGLRIVLGIPSLKSTFPTKPVEKVLVTATG